MFFCLFAIFDDRKKMMNFTDNFIVYPEGYVMVRQTSVTALHDKSLRRIQLNFSMSSYGGAVLKYLKKLEIRNLQLWAKEISKKKF